MSRRSKFRPAARRDVLRLKEFFAEAPPDVAEVLVRLIEERVARLRSFPFIGRPLGRADLRETVVRFGKSTYIIRYRVTDDLIDITRIWHGRENRG